MGDLAARILLAAGEGPAGLFSGVRPDWGPLAALGDKAKVLVGIVWAAAVMVAVIFVIWGAAQQRVGTSTYNTMAAERGKHMFQSGLVGLVILGSVMTLTALVYNLAQG